MKVIFKYMQLVLLALLFVGCSKDKEEIYQVIIEQPYSFTLAIDEGSAVSYPIKANDRVGINGEAYPVLYNGVVSLYEVPVEPQYLVYYPAHATILQERVLQFILPAAQKYVEGSVDPKAYPLYNLSDNGGLDTMRMLPACGGLKLLVPANETFSAITSVTITSETDRLQGSLQVNAETGAFELLEDEAVGGRKVSLQGNMNISKDTELFVALPPMSFTDVLDIKLSTLKGIGRYRVDLSGEHIEPGQFLTVDLAGVEWMIKTDYYGKANSVIVAPGASAVTVDCAPYYTTSLLYTYENHPDEEEGRLARSAKMLWNDVSTDFVGDVVLAGDGKSFTAQLNGQPGNALIAIYDKADPNASDATILWSFHIWVTEVNEIPLGTNGKGNTYTMLDRNLGAVSATAGDQGAIGMLYQWGRKDPFVSTGAIGQNSNAPMYNQSGSVGLSVVAGGSSTGTLAYATQNPTRFIRSAQTGSSTGSRPFRYAHDWLYHANDALWGNPEGYQFPAFSTLHKTIYDPSPEGYMVAPADVWLKEASGNNKAASIFAEAVWDVTNLGYHVRLNGVDNWYTIGGWRSRSNGSLSNANSTGYYWSSSVVGAVNANAWYMSINSGGATLNGANSRANSASIRPVKVSN